MYSLKVATDFTICKNVFFTREMKTYIYWNVDHNMTTRIKMMQRLCRRRMLAKNNAKVQITDKVRNYYLNENGYLIFKLHNILSNNGSDDTHTCITFLHCRRFHCCLHKLSTLLNLVWDERATTGVKFMLIATPISLSKRIRL